jgi:hypothetical protein
MSPNPGIFDMSPNPGIAGAADDVLDADATSDVIRGVERLRAGCLRAVWVPADAAAAFLAMACSCGQEG